MGRINDIICVWVSNVSLTRKINSICGTCGINYDYSYSGSNTALLEYFNYNIIKDITILESEFDSYVEWYLSMFGRKETDICGVGLETSLIILCFQNNVYFRSDIVSFALKYRITSVKQSLMDFCYKSFDTTDLLDNYGLKMVVLNNLKRNKMFTRSDIVNYIKRVGDSDFKNIALLGDNGRDEIYSKLRLDLDEYKVESLIISLDNVSGYISDLDGGTREFIKRKKITRLTAERLVGNILLDFEYESLYNYIDKIKKNDKIIKFISDLRAGVGKSEILNRYGYTEYNYISLEENLCKYLKNWVACDGVSLNSFISDTTLLTKLRKYNIETINQFTSKETILMIVTGNSFTDIIGYKIICDKIISDCREHCVLKPKTRHISVVASNTKDNIRKCKNLESIKQVLSGVEFEDFESYLKFKEISHDAEIDWSDIFKNWLSYDINSNIFS